MTNKPWDEQTQHAIDEVQAAIKAAFPEAALQVHRGEDPTGISIDASTKAEHGFDGLDVIGDRLVDAVSRQAWASLWSLCSRPRPDLYRGKSGKPCEMRGRIRTIPGLITVNVCASSVSSSRITAEMIPTSGPGNHPAQRIRTTPVVTRRWRDTSSPKSFSAVSSKASAAFAPNQHHVLGNTRFHLHDSEQHMPIWHRRSTWRNRAAYGHWARLEGLRPAP